MADIEKFKAKYSELKALEIPDDAIIAKAKENGYTDEEIASVINGYNNAEAQAWDNASLQPAEGVVDEAEQPEIAQPSNTALPSSISDFLANNPEYIEPQEPVSEQVTSPMQLDTPPAVEETQPMYVGEMYNAQQPTVSQATGELISVGREFERIENGGVTPATPTTNREESPLSNPDIVDIDPLAKNTFLTKQADVYSSIINGIIDADGDTNRFKQQLREAYYAQSLESGAAPLEAEQVANQNADELMKNFEISRYIQNNTYNPETVTDTASRVDKFKTLQKKFNLTDEETEYWNEQWKTHAPSLFQSVDKALDNFSVAAKQDWNGFLALGYKLFGMKEKEAEAQAKIAELDAQAKRINVERGEKFGAEDLSPVAIGEAVAATALALSTAPVSAVIGATAVTGAAANAIYAKGQNEKDSAVALNAALGGALPIAIPAVVNMVGSLGGMVRNFFNVSGIYKKEIAAGLADVPLQDALATINFFEKNGGLATEVGFFSKGSNAEQNAVVFRSLASIFGMNRVEDNIVFRNNAATVKGVKDFLNSFERIKPSVTSTDAALLSNDAVAESLTKAIQTAHTQMSSSIKKQYDNIEAVANDVIAPDTTKVLESLYSYLDNLPNAFPSDVLDKQIEKVGVKLAHLATEGLRNGGISLKNLMDLQQSIKRDIQFTTPSSKQIVATTNLQINKAKEEIIDDALKALQNKNPIELTDIDMTMVEKLGSLKDDIAKANIDYQNKIKTYGKQSLKRFLDVEGNSLQASKFVDDLIDKADFETIGTVKMLYNSVDKAEDFKLLGQRYILNNLGDVVNATDSKLAPNIITKFDKILNNQNLLKAFDIPQETIEQMKVISNSLKLGARMKQFYSTATAPQRLLLGKLGFLAGNFVDSVKNLIARKSYNNKELAKLVEEAKKFESKSYELLETQRNKSLRTGAALGELTAIKSNVSGE